MSVFQPFTMLIKQQHQQRQQQKPIWILCCAWIFLFPTKDMQSFVEKTFLSLLLSSFNFVLNQVSVYWKRAVSELPNLFPHFSKPIPMTLS